MRTQSNVSEESKGPRPVTPAAHSDLRPELIWNGARYFDGGLTSARSIDAPEACVTSMLALEALAPVKATGSLQSGFKEALAAGQEFFLDHRLSWPVQNKHAGKVWFEMEQTGGPSRWNTLRALRVQRWAHTARVTEL